MPPHPDRLPRPPEPESTQVPGPEHCVVGEMLCEVRTWTDEE